MTDVETDTARCPKCRAVISVDFCSDDFLRTSQHAPVGIFEKIVACPCGYAFEADYYSTTLEATDD